MGPDGDRIRVVVVDDHAVVRSGLLAFLEGENDLEVVGAAEGIGVGLGDRVGHDRRAMPIT